MLAMTFLLADMIVVPVCLIALTWVLAAYKRRCDMHPETFAPTEEA